MKTVYNETMLLGVPHYQQGNADGLCVYYAISMVIVALFPEYYKTIHNPPRYKKIGSPIFLMLKEYAQDGNKFNEEMGRWFLNGMHMTDAAKLLNDLARKYYKNDKNKDYFLHHKVLCRRNRKQKDIWNVIDIRNALCWHLPVIIAGGGIQSHAVVAVGWGAVGKKVWIEYQDPACVKMGSAYASDIFYNDCEAIIPNPKHFMKHRPPVISIRDKDSYYEAWDPKLWPNK